jgi:putative membrane-bound dehydrogenase-like protein
MKLRIIVPALALFCAIVPLTVAQVPPEKVENTFTVSDGLEIKLWASEPLFVNPTCIDIDHKGRVWVCESVNYRHSLHHRPPLRPEGDRIVILEDTSGSGKANKATTFYQSKELLAPMGIAVAKDPSGPGYKVYVCQSPDILLFEDKDGDGKADGPPRKLLSGFRGIDHDHGVHGIVIGPDMKLYFSVGDQGVDGLVDKNGKKWKTNHTDCQGGTIWRCDLDGKNLELLAHNFRNEYEPCVDSFGTIFVSDNDDDGNEQTRICYVMPGGNYGYWPRGPGQTHWHEEQPGVVPKILRTYFGSPTGMCVYEGKLLPKKYQGQLLHTDAGPRHLRSYRLTPKGAGYAVEREDMVTSTDNWFRPSDVCVAPDGSVYVADWYDPGVGGHGMGDTTRGRIYRVAPKGNKPSVPAVDLESKDGLRSALASPAQSVKYMAMAKVQSMKSADAARFLEGAVKSADRVLAARALWQLAILQSKSPDKPVAESLVAALRLASTSDDPNVRRQCVRIVKELASQGRLPSLGSSATDTVGELSRLCDDPAPAVRAELLLALRDVDAAAAKPLILKLAKQYDGEDRFYLAAVGIAVGHDERRRSIILDDFEKQFPGWNEQIGNLVWELRPPAMLRGLDKRLTDSSLHATQRAQIVDIIAASTEIDAGKKLLNSLCQNLPTEVRDRIVQSLVLSLPGKWRELRQSNELTAALHTLLPSANTRAMALKLVSAGKRTDLCQDVIRIAEHDHENEQQRLSAIRTLGTLATDEAVRVLCAIGRDANKHVALRHEAILALGAQTQANGRSGSSALASLTDLLAEKPQNADLRQAILTALTGTRNGSIWLLEARKRNELHADVVADAGRLLRNSPYQDLRNRAMIAFPPRRLDPAKLPRIDALTARTGNAMRGKQLIQDSARTEIQCLKCHTIGGTGGKIGPDLSSIGKKASRENLLESILLPSKAIADQYVTWLVATNGGLLVSGLLVEETPDSITVRDANGKDTKIDKKEIESRTKSPTSLMPSDLLAYMTEEDLLDIVEYLLELKAAE